MKKIQEEIIKPNDHFADKTEHFELINGKFTAKDAKEILLQLVGDKIKYHQLKNLSSLERSGEFDKVSSRRLPELQLQNKKILEIFKNGEISKSTFKIQATIHIEISE